MSRFAQSSCEDNRVGSKYRGVKVETMVCAREANKRKALLHRGFFGQSRWRIDGTLEYALPIGDKGIFGNFKIETDGIRRIVRDGKRSHDFVQKIHSETADISTALDEQFCVGMAEIQGVCLEIGKTMRICDLQHFTSDFDGNASVDVFVAKGDKTRDRKLCSHDGNFASF